MAAEWYLGVVVSSLKRNPVPTGSRVSGFALFDFDGIKEFAGYLGPVGDLSGAEDLDLPDGGLFLDHED